MPEADSVRGCSAVKPWVGGRAHDCEKDSGHHGSHRCDCGERWDNESNLTPCVATAVAVLGVVGDPVRLRCGLQEDHADDHRFAITWRGTGAPIDGSGATDA